MMSKISLKVILPIVTFILFWVIPTPEGLSVEGWRFLAVFFAVVVGLIMEPIPAALIGLIGISLVAVLGLVGNSKESISWALSGFSNSVIWLIFTAFMFALGYKKTGLGKRVSLILIKYMGKSSLGLGYAVAFSDLILAPFMPSNTARSAGTIYPVVINIPIIFNSTPQNEPRKLGSYITWVAIASMCITSSMFLTALAPNLLAVELIGQSTGNVISWSAWVNMMLPLMLPLFLLSPLLVYLIYPPTQKKSPEAPAWAAEELKKLGKITYKEILMAGLALLALLLWIFGGNFGIHSTTAALSVLVIMVLANVISWDDVISNKAAFNVLIWFASLVALAAGLKNVGVLSWIGNIAEVHLASMTPTMLYLSMLVLFFVLHYFFASTTAHTTALLPIFMAIAVKLMSPEQILPFSILLAGSLGLMGVITPYATGPSPIWYGAGYISQAKWWGLGAIFGTLYLLVILLGAFIFI